MPAGYSLPRLCIDVARRGLSGIEGLGGIPGTVGGALWMNAGAYGHEIGLSRRRCASRAKARWLKFPAAKCNGTTVTRHFKEGELLLGATLRLTPDDPEKIRARMEDAKSRRMATQPHGSRSAGCFFKNPPSATVGTGKMIDEMGMKGARTRKRGRFCRCMRISSSLKVKARRPKMRWRWPKRFVNASSANTELSWNMKLNLARQRKQRQAEHRTNVD